MASEQDSPNPSEEQSGTANPEGLRAPDQEPAESECVKMDEEEKPAASEETPSTDEGLSRDGPEEKEMDTEAALVQKGGGGAENSADVTGELRQEQREEEESVSSPLHCAVRKGEDKTGTEMKRRASVEISSSDGEPLSRIDSEDRSVYTAHVPYTPSPAG